jgi:hypothetical protein
VSVDNVRKIYTSIIQDGHISTAELNQFLDQSDPPDACPLSFGSFVDRNEFAVANGLYKSLQVKDFSCDKGVLGQLSGFVERGDDKVNLSYLFRGFTTSAFIGITFGAVAGAYGGNFATVGAGAFIGVIVGIVVAPLYILADD